MFRFYKTILNLKTRLQEQNLKKILIFFHYHLNLFICCKTKLKIKFIFYWMSLFKQNECFYRVIFFWTELNFLKGDTNIYFECITLFEKKKIFTEKNKIFVKIIHIFFLKIFFFQIVLLHLNNHTRLHIQLFFQNKKLWKGGSAW